MMFILFQDMIKHSRKRNIIFLLVVFPHLGFLLNNCYLKNGLTNYFGMLLYNTNYFKILQRLFLNCSLKTTYQRIPLKFSTSTRSYCFISSNVAFNRNEEFNTLYQDFDAECCQTCVKLVGKELGIYILQHEKLSCRKSILSNEVLSFSLLLQATLEPKSI